MLLSLTSDASQYVDRIPSDASGLLQGPLNLQQALKATDVQKVFGRYLLSR